MAQESFNKIFIKIQSTLPKCIEANDTNLLKKIFDCKISESVKCFVEASIRDFLLKKVCIGYSSNLNHVKLIVNMCIEGVRQDLCLPTLPVLVLSDAFECLTIAQSEELFEFVESNVSVWREEPFFTPCKTQVLRMCNDVLRRLSRSQNTIFCGRILLFLARFFPFSERSGLNLISEFNLENVTSYTDTETMEIDSKEGLDVNQQKSTLDYTLYTKFWALQDYFRNPIQCYEPSSWKIFSKYTEDILEAFTSYKLEQIESKSSKRKSSAVLHEEVINLCKEDQYFPKYLTNQKLLDLQFSDSNFRRYILVQVLILCQYLNSKIKFKQETLDDEQKIYVKKTQEKTYNLIAETPPNGKEFVEIVKKILKREEIWSEWKNNGCPQITKPGTSMKRKHDDKSSEDKVKRRKTVPSIGELLKDSDSKNKFILGNTEMTRLWNIFPNNLEACQQKSRDFVPSLEIYFQTAIEQSVSKNPPKEGEALVHDSNFGWRGLRLLASKSPHFFTHSVNPIMTLPEYLSSMVKKLAKDIPHFEDIEEEEKDIAMLDNTVKTEEEEEDLEEEESDEREELKPINEEEMKLLAKAFAAAEANQWKLLGKKLGFSQDELEYFETENKILEDAIRVMFERWVENEKEEANKDNLLYTIEGLKMNQIVKEFV